MWPGRRRDAQVDPGHDLGHAVNVVGAAAQPAVFFGDEKQVQAQLARIV